MFYLLRVHIEFLPSHCYLLISLGSFAICFEGIKKQLPDAVNNAITVNFIF